MKKMFIATLGLFVLLGVSAWGSATECLKCHGANAADDVKSIVIDPELIKGSIHGDLDCNDCHNIQSDKPHKGVRDVLCGTCHAEEAQKYALSPHVEGKKVSAEDIPSCFSCHGGHDILAISDERSRVNHKNSVKVCIKCHEDQSIKDKFDVLPEPQMIKAYENSVHGYALMVEGNMDAPACVDCHGSHSFLPSDRPDSPIGKKKIAETCGRCHEQIKNDYESSVHGVTLANGVMESPTCTDCHGEHDIKAHLDENSKVYATHIPETCSACHASEKVVGKYGLKADRIETFKESFHGTGLEFGEPRFANCASCHGYHKVYQQSDSRSLINKANIQNTCGQCHDDLPEDFAQGTVHVAAEKDSSTGTYYVRKFYYIFIPIIIIGFIVYRVLEYKRRAKKAE